MNTPPPFRHRKNAACHRRRRFLSLWLALVLTWAGGAGLYAQIFFYDFNDCQGGKATQVASSASSHLPAATIEPEGRQPAAKYWSADHLGVSGKPGDYALDLTSASGMGKKGKGALAMVRDADSVLAHLKSFTVCGWFKAHEPVGGGARLFDAQDGGGNGILVAFDDDHRVGFQVNLGGWKCTELLFNDVDTWVFVAATYDSTQSSDNVVFYKGLAGQKLASQRIDARDTSALTNLSHAALCLGNNTGLERPLKGLLDNLAVYGSTEDNTGALNEAAVDKVYRSATAPGVGKQTR